MPTQHADYSATPLWRKLGIREGARVAILRAPDGFVALLRPLPHEVEIRSRASSDLDVIVLFATERRDLDRRFPSLAGRLVPAGRLWVAWPKKAAGISTDLDFGTVQAIGLGSGLVDNKSASITDAFQGLQFVRRLRDRPR